MRRVALLSTLMLVACGKPVGVAAGSNNIAAPSGAPTDTTMMTLRAGDGVTVFARRYDARRPKALILLFHQAGSSKNEYATIAPRLAAAGYASLAVDARAGGNLYGVNETAAAFSAGIDNIDARQDLQAAIDWATRQRLPVILWGSSYSASLVFPLAVANQGKVRAILAFSPGEYFDDKPSIRQAAARVTVPVFVTSASTPAEIAAAKAIAAAVPGGHAEQYVPQDGVHGASTLIAAKDPKGAEANWHAVMAFLTKVVP